MTTVTAGVTRHATVTVTDKLLVRGEIISTRMCVRERARGKSESVCGSHPQRPFLA